MSIRKCYQPSLMYEFYIKLTISVTVCRFLRHFAFVFTNETQTDYVPIKRLPQRGKVAPKVTDEVF